MDRIGYRVVSWTETDGLTSIAGGVRLGLEIGKMDDMPGEGLFLGTTREFCEDYYTGLTDGDDILLTYAYEDDDVLRGAPGSSAGEVTVRRARLLAIENLSRPCLDTSRLLRGDAAEGPQR